MYVWFFLQSLSQNAQIARESIKKNRELPGPLSGPWTPAVRDFGLRARDERARAKKLRASPPPPPPWIPPNENPGSRYQRKLF